jgi:hypothetical protein
VARPVLPALLIIGGGILALLGGLVLVGTGGITGEIGAVVGAALIAVGFLLALLPSARTVLAFVALGLGMLSIPFALAGFVVGIFLTILGGILGFLWVPPSSDARERS